MFDWKGADDLAAQTTMVLPVGYWVERSTDIELGRK